MTNLKSSSSFSPMTFRDYMQKFLTLCNQKDNAGWGWFIDIEQHNNNNNKPKTILQKIFRRQPHQPHQPHQVNNSPIRYNRSYSDIKTSSEFLFLMDEDINPNTEPNIYKKITCNMIGIMFVIVIYVILL